MRLFLLSILLAPVVAHAQRTDDSLRHALLAAEDARARTPAELDLLVATSRSGHAGHAAIAVRALGRLERADLLPQIAPSLRHADPSVRAAGAVAMAQAAGADRAAEAWQVLRTEAAQETDGAVQRAILESIGRLRLAPDTPDHGAAQRLLLDAAMRDGGARTGALQGLGHLLRRRPASTPPDPELFAALRRLAAAPMPASDRRLALAAIAAARAGDEATLATALGDDDTEVRRLAAAALRTTLLEARARLIDLALEDAAFQVRIEALRAFGQHRRTTVGCEPLFRLLADPSPHVVLLAIDLIGAGCLPAERPASVLDLLVWEPLTATAWHRPAHALVALAGTDSARARVELPRFVSAEVWWARVYAARAAARLRDSTTLRRLLADPHPNVREEALRALFAIEGHAADSAAIAQLDSTDDQLLLTAASLLKDAPAGAAAVPALLDALDRVSAERKETSRDTRLALLARVADFGTAADSARLLPRVTDYDPRVADEAAALLTRWTGHEVVPAPRPLDPLPLPTPAELGGMTSAVIVMADGGRLTVRLRPDLAPTNVARFVRMARAGWFDGLTLHRVVPNFVLQGGSPGANEYVGAAEFSRDELGGSHVRGTVGISTRGRDTGDGQIFVNLVDNLRLDHDYTVIGAIVEGLDVMDRILEGAVIARVETRP